MGRPALELHRRRLANLLGITADNELALLIWAISTLQSSNPQPAVGVIDYPPEAVTNEIGSQYYAHPWRMETLFNELLVTRKQKTNAFYQKKFRCDSFNAIAILMNALGKIEDQEAGLNLNKDNILNELHRVAQRQFEWQRGFVNLGSIYRSSFLYGGELAQRRFLERKGISFNDFSRCCFALMATFSNHAIMPVRLDFSTVGISQDTLSATLNTVAIGHKNARELALQQRTGASQAAYKQSVLRQYPIIIFEEGGENAIAPLPQLIASRATSGVYYDLLGNPGDVINEISKRFEIYCRRMIASIVPAADLLSGYNYLSRGNNYESYDAAILKGGSIAVIIECKATKLTFNAKFAEFPLVEAEGKYAEIVKGVYQIWRYVSHVRRGIAPPEAMATDVVGVILTLDTWLMLSSSMQKEVIERAVVFASREDPGIEPQDQIPVIFCPIDDLEVALSNCTLDTLMESIARAATDEYFGWMIYSVHQQLFPDVKHRRPHPLLNEISNVAPWWAEIQAMIRARNLQLS